MTHPAPASPPIPDHEMLDCVGRGSYGEVWLARSVTGRYRAIKIVHRETFDNDRPFEREFSGIKNYEPISRTHAGLVAILHVGRGEGCFYYVMEIADDQQTGSQIHPAQYTPRTLSSDLAHRQRLPVADCLKLGQSLTEALEHLHQQGLVHRDIKPSNIIFVNGAPKFADIGLVTEMGEKATFVGTAGYIPPEGPGSATADIYSLGKVLYEMSMGKDREEFPELPTALRELPDAPALVQLNSIILRACASNAERRFGSAADMHRSLTQLAEVLTSSATAGQPPPSATIADHPTVVILNPGEDAGDAELARVLVADLAQAGIPCRLDDQTQPSVAWARELEAQLERAAVIIARLSPANRANEMLKYGLEITRQLQSNNAPSPKLMVIRQGAEAPPPHALAAWLDQATSIDWNGPHDTPRTTAFVMAQIRKLTSAPAAGAAREEK